eukprot:1169172_1
MYHDEPRYSTFIIITWHRLEAILAQILSFKSSHKSSQNYMKRIDTDQNHHHHLKRHTHARITAIIGEYHALYEDDAQIMKRIDTNQGRVSNAMFGNKMKGNTAM